MGIDLPNWAVVLVMLTVCASAVICTAMIIRVASDIRRQTRLEQARYLLREEREEEREQEVMKLREALDKWPAYQLDNQPAETNEPNDHKED